MQKFIICVGVILSAGLISACEQKTSASHSPSPTPTRTPTPTPLARNPQQEPVGEAEVAVVRRYSPVDFQRRVVFGGRYALHNDALRILKKFKNQLREALNEEVQTKLAFLNALRAGITGVTDQAFPAVTYYDIENIDFIPLNN